MTSWASPRDEFPESVHALMSLWGGFGTPAAQVADGALEKRLELDLVPGSGASPLSVPELEALLLPLGQSLEDFAPSAAANGITTATFSDMLVVLMRDRIVVTSGAVFLLHELVRPLLAALSAKGACVEWAAFFRKNILSPWALDGASDAATCDVMASEYAELKAAFPAGQSFLTGPVDGDHYFHFVYDNIARECDGAAARAEADTQVNVFLYDCEAGEDGGVGVKDELRVVPLPGPTGAGRRPEYESLRTFAAFPHVSFESNALSASQDVTRVSALVDTFAPARFIIVALKDKDFSDDASAFVDFDGYVRQHRSINYFGSGYAFHQFVYVRAE